MRPLRPSTAVQRAFEAHVKEGKEGILHVRKLPVALQDAMSCTSDEAIAELRRVDASGHDVQLRVKGELDVGEFTELVLVIRRQQLDALLTETTAAERRLTELRHRVKREEAQLEQKRVEKGLPADVEAMATLLGAAVAAGDDAAIRVQAHALLAKAKSIEGRSRGDLTLTLTLALTLTLTLTLPVTVTLILAQDRRKRLAKEHLTKKHPGISARSPTEDFGQGAVIATRKMKAAEAAARAEAKGHAMRDAAHVAAEAAGAEAAEQLKAARAETEVFRGQAKAAAIAQVKAEELARTARAQAAKEAKAARLEAVELRQALAHAKAVAAQAVAEATAVKEASKREAANTKRRMDRQTERASQSQGLMKPLSARAGVTAAPPTARAARAPSSRVGALSEELVAEIEGRIGDAISAVLFRSRKAASAAEILSAVATIILSPPPAAVGDTELGSAPPPQQQPPPQLQPPDAPQPQPQPQELRLQQAPVVASPRAAPSPEESAEAGAVEPGDGSGEGELVAAVVR